MYKFFMEITGKGLNLSHKPKFDHMTKYILGFSVLELLLITAVLGILLSIALPNYSEYIRNSRANKAMEVMQGIEINLHDYKIDMGRYPETLSEINMTILDPWGNPYQYLAIEGAGNARRGHQRKDHNLVPINSDFDLYSMGEDGRSSPPITASHSHDDIIRANNGAYYGYAEDY
ncbi:MAG: prepilin-type cleavage/methylation domain-containing protein [Candidatus Thiodiazotropha sp.]